MAEEVWYVSYDIQEATEAIGAGRTAANNLYFFSKKGSGSEASFPPVTQETNSINSAGGEGFSGPISISKNIEITAGSEAEAIEMVRKTFGNNAGKVRALVKPNTNFKITL